MRTTPRNLHSLAALAGALVSPALFDATVDVATGGVTQHLPLFALLGAGLTVLLTAGTVLMTCALLHAPEAYEDECGFHLRHAPTRRSDGAMMASTRV
jgi:hypothetical protein